MFFHGRNFSRRTRGRPSALITITPYSATPHHTTIHAQLRPTVCHWLLATSASRRSADNKLVSALPSAAPANTATSSHCASDARFSGRWAATAQWLTPAPRQEHQQPDQFNRDKVTDWACLWAGNNAVNGGFYAGEFGTCLRSSPKVGSEAQPDASPTRWREPYQSTHEIAGWVFSSPGRLFPCVLRAFSGGRPRRTDGRMGLRTRKFAAFTSAAPSRLRGGRRRRDHLSPRC